MATDKAVATAKPPREARVRPSNVGRPAGTAPGVSGSPVVRRVRKYLGEVMIELKKAHWPGKPELIAQTQVVLGLLVAIGVSVAVCDLLLGLIFKGLLRLIGAER